MCDCGLFCGTRFIRENDPRSNRQCTQDGTYRMVSNTHVVNSWRSCSLFDVHSPLLFGTFQCCALCSRQHALCVCCLSSRDSYDSIIVLLRPPPVVCCFWLVLPRMVRQSPATYHSIPFYGSLRFGSVLCVLSHWIDEAFVYYMD